MMAAKNLQTWAQGRLWKLRNLQGPELRFQCWDGLGQPQLAQLWCTLPAQDQPTAVGCPSSTDKPSNPAVNPGSKHNRTHLDDMPETAPPDLPAHCTHVIPSNGVVRVRCKVCKSVTLKSCQYLRWRETTTGLPNDTKNQDIS